MKRTINILISSPGDVLEEREKARKVIAQLEKQFRGQFELKPILWEDLPLTSDLSFQEGIDIVLSQRYRVDIAIFILWSRLGSPLGNSIIKNDGKGYLSGTEREFDLMLEARKQAKSGYPQILVYLRDDQTSFLDHQKGKTIGQLKDIIDQKEKLELFISEKFHETQTGTNLRAYHTYKQPMSFANRLRVHLLELLNNISTAELFKEALWDNPPYQGLEVFDLQHAPIFFGRDKEICEIHEALSHQAALNKAFLMIIGPSGSGKSSLARAGVMNQIINLNLDESAVLWRKAIFTPGMYADNLMEGLAKTISSKDAVPELCCNGLAPVEFADALKKDPAIAINLLVKTTLARLSGELGGKVKLLLLVDQLEELFTYSNLQRNDIELFLETIKALSESDCVWVLSTIRSDFYQYIYKYPLLMDLKQDKGQYDLQLPKPSAVHRIIVEPANMAGIKFESSQEIHETLDQKILNDISGHEEALPLLEFALRELYERRNSDGVMTYAAYESIGGIEGAVGKRADIVVKNLKPEVRRMLPWLFDELITCDLSNGRRYARKKALLENLSRDQDKKELVDILITQRLLVAETNERGESVVYLTHESLIGSWPEIQEYIRENNNFLNNRAWINSMASKWAENRDKSFLIQHQKSLDQAEILSVCYPDELSENEKAFIYQSLRKEKRRGLTSWLSLITTIVFLLALVIYLFLSYFWAAPGNAFIIHNLLSKMGISGFQWMFNWSRSGMLLSAASILLILLWWLFKKIKPGFILNRINKDLIIYTVAVALLVLSSIIGLALLKEPFSIWLLPGLVIHCPLLFYVLKVKRQIKRWKVQRLKINRMNLFRLYIRPQARYLLSIGALILSLIIYISLDINDSKNSSSLLSSLLKSDTYTIARNFLDHNADVDAVGDNGKTLLHLAASSGDIDFAEALIDRYKANIDIIDDDERTPIFESINYNNLEFTKFLVEKGANINIRDFSDYSPFLYACELGNIEIADYLLKKGADRNVRNRDGMSASFLAAFHGYDNMLAYLINMNAIDVRNLLNNTNSGVKDPEKDLCIAAWNQNVGNYEKAEFFYDFAVQMVNPDTDEKKHFAGAILRKKAEMNESAGRFEKAAAIYLKAAEYFLGYKSAALQDDSYIKAAYNYILCGKFTEARKICENFNISVNDENLKCDYDITYAHALLFSGNFDKAKELYHKYDESHMIYSTGFLINHENDKLIRDFAIFRWLNMSPSLLDRIESDIKKNIKTFDFYFRKFDFNSYISEKSLGNLKNKITGKWNYIDEYNNNYSNIELNLKADGSFFYKYYSSDDHLYHTDYGFWSIGIDDNSVVLGEFTPGKKLVEIFTINFLDENRICYETIKTSDYSVVSTSKIYFHRLR